MHYQMILGMPPTELDEVSAIAALNDADEIGLDTETFYKGEAPRNRDGSVNWDNLNHRTGRIQYIQVFFPKRNLAVAVNVATDSKTEFIELLMNRLREGLPCLIHNALYESVWIRHHYGIIIKSPICSMVANIFYWAGLSGALKKKYQSPNSLRDALHQHFGLIVDKSEQDSDWSADLTTSQIPYMLLDPFYSYILSKKLLKLCENHPILRQTFKSIPVFAEMTINGMPFNVKRGQEILDEYQSHIDRLQNQINEKLDMIYQNHPDWLALLMPESCPKFQRVLGVLMKFYPERGWEPTKTSVSLVGDFESQHFEKRSGSKVWEPWSFNYRSHKQLLTLCNLILNSEGKKSLNSTAADLLESADFKPDSVIWDIIDVRRIEKLRGYMTNYLEHFVPELGSVTTNYHVLAPQGGGRSSANNSPLQIIPDESPVIHKYGLTSPRAAFMSTDPDRVLIVADFTASHANIATWLSKDPALLASIKTGVKVHYITLSGIFNVTDKGSYDPAYLQKLHKAKNLTGDELNLQEEIKANYRLAKIVFFSCLNRISPIGLQVGLRKKYIYMSIAECKDLIEAWKESYSGLDRYLKEIQEYATSHAKKEFIAVNPDLRLKPFLDLYGVQFSSATCEYLERNVSHVTTHDGRLLRQPLAAFEDEFSNVSEYVRPSLVASNQWLALERTIADEIADQLFTVFQNNPQWEARFCNFCHDEFDVTCNKYHSDDVVAVINTVMERVWLKWVPIYRHESCSVVENWGAK